MTKPRIRNYMNIFTFGWLIFGLLSCQPDQRKGSNNKLTAENDSIVRWLERSSDEALSIEEQGVWLAKALEEVRNQPDDTIKTEYFSQISLQYLRRKDSLQFRKTNRESIALAKKVGDSVNHAESHWDLATFFNNYSIPDSAYYHYGEAHKIYNLMNDRLFSGRMLYNMASIQSGIKDYIGSEINTVKAIRLLNYENNITIYCKESDFSKKVSRLYLSTRNYR